MQKRMYQAVVKKLQTSGVHLIQILTKLSMKRSNNAFNHYSCVLDIIIVKIEEYDNVLVNQRSKKSQICQVFISLKLLVNINLWFQPRLLNSVVLYDIALTSSEVEVESRRYLNLPT